MPFDLGHHPALPAPRRRLVGEVGVDALHMVGRATDRAAEQVADAPLRDRIGLEAGRVFEAPGFQEVIEVGYGEGGVAPEEAPRYRRAAVSLDPRFQHRAPVVGAGHLPSRRAERSRSPNRLNRNRG